MAASGVPPHVRARAEYIKGVVTAAQEEALMYQNALGVGDLAHISSMSIVAVAVASIMLCMAQRMQVFVTFGLFSSAAY